MRISLGQNNYGKSRVRMLRLSRQERHHEIKELTLDEVFAANCLLATRYRDPFRNTPASFEETLDLLALWRKVETANRRIAVCVGMSFWKRRRVADFLRSTAGTPASRPPSLPKGVLAAATITTLCSLIAL